MVLKILFWLFVALDAAGLGLWFLLGLAAAGSARTSPFGVLGLIAVPALLLAGAGALFVRTQSSGLRLVALLVVAAPFLLVTVGQLVGGYFALRLYQQGRMYGSTELTTALDRLEKDPGQLARVRELVAQGVDLTAGEMLPLAMAIYATRHAGDEPLRILLDAGADPNHVNEFGAPAWFAATGGAIDVRVMQLLIDRGADLQAKGRDGRGGVWDAVNTENWPVALLLVQRGAYIGGISPMGLPLRATLEGLLRGVRAGEMRGAAEVLAAVVARDKGK